VSNIRIIALEGTKYKMGIEYGRQLALEMKLALDILYKFFIEEHKISLDKLIAKADQFYSKYPYGYQNFIKGVSYGSGLALNEVKILNAMETLHSLVRKDPKKEELSGCSFLSIPPIYSASGHNIIGRNYDYFAPYDKIAKYLTVTIINETDSIPTAIIAMPGQIYCPTCINANSLFIELNNGMPSGGFVANHNSQSMLITLLEVAQNSENFSQMDKLLSSRDSDYSLIINTANKTHAKSYEFSSFNGDQYYIPKENTIFASTNFYQNETWNTHTKLTEESTWKGFSRRDNLIKGVGKYFTIEDTKKLLDMHHDDGGAKWEFTIYQIIFDSYSQELCLKITQEDHQWTCFQDLFGINSQYQET
jgi:hypothetical protein